MVFATHISQCADTTVSCSEPSHAAAMSTGQMPLSLHTHKSGMHDNVMALVSRARQPWRLARRTELCVQLNHQLSDANIKSWQVGS